MSVDRVWSLRRVTGDTPGGNPRVRVAVYQRCRGSDGISRWRWVEDLGPPRAWRNGDWRRGGDRMGYVLSHDALKAGGIPYQRGVVNHRHAPLLSDFLDPAEETAWRLGATDARFYVGRHFSNKAAPVAVLLRVDSDNLPVVERNEFYRRWLRARGTTHDPHMVFRLVRCLPSMRAEDWERFLSAAQGRWGAQPFPLPVARLKLPVPRTPGKLTA